MYQDLRGNTYQLLLEDIGASINFIVSSRSPAGLPANFPAKNGVQGGGLGGLRPLSPGFHFTSSKFHWRFPARFQLDRQHPASFPINFS
jgi:hypothetical protein